MQAKATMRYHWVVLEKKKSVTILNAGEEVVDYNPVDCWCTIHDAVSLTIFWTVSYNTKHEATLQPGYYILGIYYREMKTSVHKETYA